MRAAWRAASLSTLCAAAAVVGVAAAATASSDASQQRWTVAARHLVTHAQRLGAAAACRPWTVPPPQRCEYVRQHCGDLAGNLLDFLELHFCELGDRPWASVLLQLSWMLLMFLIMLEVCDRFFCPAIERISEWLQLSPTVAGATLLAFGNGATDLFTQIAMALSGKPRDESFEMALTEPLGTGMFVTHMVVAFIILATPMRRVEVSRVNFMKDCCFFLGAVVGLLAVLLRGRVDRWQTVLPFIYYATYIIATIVLGRGAEPLHADPRRHEIPHFRTTSYLDDVWVERAAAELQAERQVQALALALEQQRREDDERQQQLRLQPQQQGQQGQDGDCERQLQLQLQRQGQQGQGQVVHVVVGSQDDAHACSNGASNATCEAKAAIGTQRTHCHEVAADEAGHDSQDPTSGQRQSFGQRQCALDRSGSMRPPHGLFDLLQGVWTGRIRVGRRGGGAGSSRRDSVAAGAGVESGSALQQPLLQQQPQQPQQPQQQIHRQPQAGGCMALVAAHCDDMTPDTPPAPGACPSCGVCGPSPCDADPEQAKRAQHAQHAQHAQQPCTMGCGVCGRALLRDPQLGLQYPDSSSHDKDAGARKRPRFGDLRGGRGHSDIAEGLRHSDDGDSEDGLCIGGGGGGGVQIRWGRLLRSPVTFMLSITMPLISNREGSGAKYRKPHAVLLPLVLPLLLTAYLWDFNPFTADWAHSRSLQWTLAACCSASLLFLSAYPESGTLRGPMLGVCTVLAFLGSMVWMRFAAEEVVAVTMAAGTIFDISSPILAATLLSWAGAAGDTIANLSLARDGFPTMALTACFSSPLFVLLGGLTCTLVIFASEGQGAIILPSEDELTVLYASCVVCSTIWVIAMPLVFKFKLTAKTAAMAISMYLAFQAVFIYFAQT